MAPRNKATAFAPASAANVAIGFDILGFSVDVLGDKCTVTRTEKPGVTIAGSSGVVNTPREPERNTAGRALLAMQEVLKPGFGFEAHIEKGIPLGSGLGGSAASAVSTNVLGPTAHRAHCRASALDPLDLHIFQ